MALRTRLAHAAALVVLGAASAAATLLAVRAELAAAAGCGPVDPLDGALTAALGAGAFGLGHLAARRRARVSGVIVPSRPRRTMVAVRLVVAAVLLLATALLVYETAAILRVGGLHTITAFVRCARGQAPGITAAAAATVCFLAGHWLWYPPERAR